MPKIGYLTLDNPIAIVSSSQRFEKDRISKFNGSAGLLLLGNFDLNRESISSIEEAISEIDAPSQIGISVIPSDVDKAIEAALLAARRQILLELDCTNGVEMGQIPNLIKNIKRCGTTISVRITPSATGDKEDVRSLEAAGADIIHLDLTGLDGKGAKAIKRTSDAGGQSIMAMYDVPDLDSAKNLLSMGAKFISMSEKSDPEFVEWLSQALKKYGRAVGWYNAPKHICAGGDLRGLAFCCPPIKNCPVLGAIRKIGLSPREFIEKKIEIGRGTPLQYGDGTCFGSMVWCCKVTKPCFMRDAVLKRLGLSASDYMLLKKKMAEDLLKS
jgi:putative methanogenesis marker domain 9